MSFTPESPLTPKGGISLLPEGSQLKGLSKHVSLPSVIARKNDEAT